MGNLCSLSQLSDMDVKLMRLWSLHPKYLDCQGLLALWRESLLAKKVLKGKTKGYKKHPQLQRFKDSKNPIASINTYLFYIYKESQRRCYNFNKDKIGNKKTKDKIEVTKGQLEYEFLLLKTKLKERDKEKYKEIQRIKNPKPNSLFVPVEGPIEDWEKPKYNLIQK